MDSIKIKDLFDLSHTLLSEYLSKFEYPFEALPGIKDEIIRVGINNVVLSG